ncbi:hypothetical protein M0R45_023894 [Rubus argutus]|uniref:Uncharacterized protein n=1 Tax=Rubus argutus TaxID=59490 RepID=A0AAW1WPD6_RUBAR
MAKPRMSTKTTTTTLVTTNPSSPFFHYLLPVSPLTTLLFSPKRTVSEPQSLSHLSQSSTSLSSSPSLSWESQSSTSYPTTL